MNRPAAPRAMVVVNGDDIHHDLISAALVFQQIGTEAGFATQRAAGTGRFTDPRPETARNDVFVLYTSGGQFHPSQQEALAGMVAAGKGLVGIHCACIMNLPADRALYELLGCRYLSHGPGHHEGRHTVEVLGGHPVTEGLTDFELFDEYYEFELADDKVTVLAQRHRADGVVIPVMYAREVAQGRVVYLALGHGHAGLGRAVLPRPGAPGHDVGRRDMTAQVGVMMYTVLEQAWADLEGTLARLAAIGFRGIETYGLVEQFGPARVRRAIEAAGLELTSAHAPFPAGAEAERILDENAELGAEVLVWSMEREEFASPQAITAGLARVNEAAERAAGRGMRIAYHNHFAEFSNAFGGRQAYDLLLDQLDDRVLVELDAYWALMGGADPAEVLTRLGDRVRFIHVKDGPALSYEDDVMVPIGTGQVDWARTLTVPSGLRWHIVELERLDTDAFEALEASYAYLVGHGLSTGSVRP